MEYLEAEFTITCPDGLLQTARDLLADAAATSGFESFEDTDNGMRGYVQTALFDEEKLKSQLVNFPLQDTNVAYTVKQAEDKDWNQTWEDNGFDPIDIDNGRLVVVDANHCDGLSLPETAKVIKIDAKLAFGTGTHETTQMMVSTLLDCNLTNKRVLDCGCGTGILGIAAKKLGAGEVVGYDIDDWSVENAKHNAEINGVEMEILEGDKSVLSHVNGVFDVVLANINRNILLNDMAVFVDVMNMHATLILSGFYNEDSELLLLKAVELGLHEVDRKSEGNWCCLHLEK